MLMIPADDCVIIMGNRGFPQKRDVGEIYVGNIFDDKFDAEEIISWENQMGKSGIFQYLGWESNKFAGETLHISFWIKFVDCVPKISSGFGIQVYGEMFTNFINKCKPNTWCFIEETIKCRLKSTSIGFNTVILLFNTIAQKQTVRMSQLKVEILES